MDYDVRQLKVIAAALVVQEKSVNRLAAKEGQPESVAAEYRKVSQEIGEVMKIVIRDIDEKVSKAVKK
jgi:hypothetical protein